MHVWCRYRSREKFALKLKSALALYHTQGPFPMINTRLSMQLTFALSPYTARRSGTALTASWSSRWRRPPARSSAGYRPDEVSCGHARHELTNTACRSFHARCVSLNGRHCNRHYMYTHYFEITSFVHHCIHTFLPHSYLQASMIWVFCCIYCACTKVLNHHVIVHINTFTWWNIRPQALIHCFPTQHARAFSEETCTCNILSTHTRHTNKHAMYSL